MLNNLPASILQLIIEQKSLNLRDLINLSSTCSHLRGFILKNNALWKNRYMEKWHNVLNNSSELDDYFSEIRHVYKLQQNVDDILKKYAVIFIDKDQLSHTDFEEFILIINSRFLNREYTENYLRQIINTHAEINTYDIVSLKTPGNLTLKYYSLLTLHYLRHVYLENDFTQFCLLKEEDQILEIGATLLSQWMKPQCDIKIDNVRNQLDQITEEVKKYLKTKNPNHPLFKTCEDDLKLWRNKNIYENKFSSVDRDEVVESITRIIYEIMGFGGNESENIQNQFISDVLESKSSGKICLAIIYESIARRLGVNFDIVITKNYGLLLKLLPHDISKEVYFVDVFKQGHIYNDLTIAHARLSPESVITEMINTISLLFTNQLQPLGQRVLLIRSILELKHVLNPDNLQVIRHLANYYVKYGINTTPLQKVLHIQYYRNPKVAIDILRVLARGNVKKNSRKEGPVPLDSDLRRSASRINMKFAVGMIVKHIIEKYTCVIYGWEFHNYYPIYHVLLGNGTKKSVTQDYLKFSGVKDGLDENPEVGRYFTHFFNNEYVPNCVHNDKYAGDVKIRMKYR